MIDPHALIEQSLAQHVAPQARVVAVRERTGGAQGYSGATLHYYDVAYELPGGQNEQVALVTKDAPLRERRVLAWLADQHQLHVPWSYTADFTTDAPVLVCMQDVGGEQPPHTNFLKETAEALASIHAANLGKSDQLAWLPRADRAYFEGGFVLAMWWQEWDETMRIEEFARTWGPERPRLEAAAARFLADMDRLWAEGDSLTLIHADLHGDHVLVHGGEPYIIDWEQARYGSFYLDLPNYFKRDQVLLYRDALAAHGYDIPADVFMEHYSEASRYFAFKYFGLGLWSWRAGAPERHESVRYWIEAALNGR